MKAGEQVKYKTHGRRSAGRYKENVKGRKLDSSKRSWKLNKAKP